MSKIYFHLPGLFEFFPFYQAFIKLFNQDRDKFYDDVEIGSIYGAPPHTIWAGGRNRGGYFIVDDAVVKFINNYNIPCNLTFSNCLLTEEHLSDIHCNSLLAKFYKEGNGITVNSSILEEYIRKNYPLYSITSSTTKCLNTTGNALAEMAKDYDIVVLDYNFNNNIEFLRSLPNKEKCELLINPVCQPNCPRRSQHYEHISKTILYSNEPPMKCDYAGYLFYQAMTSPLFISRTAIETMYAPMGFQHFKIEGRTTTEFDLTEILVYYLVKPEFQMEIRQKLFNKRV